ncbi:MAG: hypothetical protein ACRD1P_04500 [Thermoanaerobaculia bacterium]
MTDTHTIARDAEVEALRKEIAELKSLNDDAFEENDQLRAELSRLREAAETVLAVNFQLRYPEPFQEALDALRAALSAPV